MDDQDKKYIKVLQLWLLIFLAIFLFLVVRWLYVDAIGNPFDLTKLKNDSNEEKRAALGALGDYFGGLLNPILAFLSFIALLYTLKLNQEELAETRKELARAAQAHEDSKKVMDEQLKTQDLQRFDSFFATLLSELSRKIENLYPNKIDTLETRIFESYGSNESKRKLIIQDNNFSSFSIFLYQILKNIDEHIDTDVDKRRYTNIVRSLIPEKILQILMINCYVGMEHHNFHRYKNLIEFFSFFEHISLYEDNNLCKSAILLSISSFYKQSAFGVNKAYKDFSESMVFKSLKDKNNFNHIVYNMAKYSVNLSLKEINDLKLGKVKLYCFRLRDKDDIPEISIVFSIKEQEYVEIRIQNRPIDQFYIREDSVSFKTSDYPNGLNFKIQRGEDGKTIFASDIIFESLRD
jgi:hypothetical protein